MNNIGTSTISEIEALKRDIYELVKEKYYLIGRVKELTEKVDKLSAQNSPVQPKKVASWLKD